MSTEGITEEERAEYLRLYGARWTDAWTRDKNLSNKRQLCERCGGTGNEMYTYYRKCHDCGGTGIERTA